MSVMTALSQGLVALITEVKVRFLAERVVIQGWERAAVSASDLNPRPQSHCSAFLLPSVASRSSPAFDSNGPKRL
jgi:hypothetical protein